MWAHLFVLYVRIWLRLLLKGSSQDLSVAVKCSDGSVLLGGSGKLLLVMLQEILEFISDCKYWQNGVCHCVTIGLKSLTFSK